MPIDKYSLDLLNALKIVINFYQKNEDDVTFAELCNKYNDLRNQIEEDKKIIDENNE